MLGDLIDHVRDDAPQVSESKVQMLFETTAEILEGLQIPFSHYEEGKESGMRQ